MNMLISELLLPEFEQEIKKTRTALERVPEDKKDFAPHPKSMPLNKLAPHLVRLALLLRSLQLPNLISQKAASSLYPLTLRRNSSKLSMKAQPQLALRSRTPQMKPGRRIGSSAFRANPSSKGRASSPTGKCSSITWCTTALSSACICA
jgi:hypothetical protein